MVRALDAALVRVRRYCGWHVSPVQSTTMTLHGSCREYIVLPSLKLGTITSITEDGRTVDPADTRQFTNEAGVLYKTCGYWTGRHIEITLTHGFTAAEAMDWREAVLSLVDQAAQSVGTGRNGALIEKKVDDVEYHWSGLPGEVENTPLDKSVLGKYRLLYV